MRRLKNQNGFTYILALTVVMIMGVMLGMIGQSWKSIMQREREKELLFRGSQIKEAIENWYNPAYHAPGVAPRARVHQLMDLKDLLQDPYSLSKARYLPHSYAAELDDKNSRCAPDCAKQKIYEDPMTGKEWTVIRGSIVNGVVTVATTTQGGIVGVASKSDDTPYKTDFKDSALENLGVTGAVVPASVSGVTPHGGVTGLTPSTVVPATTPQSTPGLGGVMTKYSEWRFIADPKNDHSKLYRGYHEGW